MTNKSSLIIDDAAKPAKATSLSNATTPSKSTSPSNASRRRFVVGTAAATAGGIGFGFFVPGKQALAQATTFTPEVNAWVVIKPDDTVVIRIARSEMGQGTLTGLAQLVAEELECDWSKVTTEYPTPGQNLARNRVWRDFSTGVRAAFVVRTITFAKVAPLLGKC